jgi:HSP20 family molecular chaperone IbpA
METGLCYEIEEHDAEVHIRVDLPEGAEDVDVDVVKDGLLIKVSENESMFCFVPLPAGLDLEQIGALAHDTHLELVIPRTI